MAGASLLRYRFGAVTVGVNAERGRGATLLGEGIPPLRFRPREADPAQAVVAELLGYGSDLVRLNAEHDLTHSLLSYVLDLPRSPALTAAACQLPELPFHRIEESAVLAIQRFANAAGVSILAAAQRLSSH